MPKFEHEYCPYSGAAVIVVVPLMAAAVLRAVLNGMAPHRFEFKFMSKKMITGRIC